MAMCGGPPSPNDKPITNKPQETPMGTGKGAPDAAPGVHPV